MVHVYNRVRCTPKVLTQSVLYVRMHGLTNVFINGLFEVIILASDMMTTLGAHREVPRVEVFRAEGQLANINKLCNVIMDELKFMN